MSQAVEFALQRRILDAAPVSKFLIGKGLRHGIEGDLKRRVTEDFKLESQGPPVVDRDGPSEPIKFSIVSLAIVTFTSPDPEQLGARMESLLFRGDPEKKVDGLMTCKSLWEDSVDAAVDRLLDKRFYGPHMLLTGLGAIVELNAKTSMTIRALASTPFMAPDEFVVLQLTPDVFRWAGTCIPEVFRTAEGKTEFRWTGSPQFRCDYHGNVGVARGRIRP